MGDGHCLLRWGLHPTIKTFVNIKLSFLTQVLPAGVMCPVAILTNAQLIMSEDVAPNRKSICALLVMARISMGNVYIVVLLFSMRFRSFLILYSDIGLVLKGEPNLNLFSQLYWVIVGSFLAVSFGLWPLSSVIKGKYILQDSNRGRACMLGKYAR